LGGGGVTTGLGAVIKGLKTRAGASGSSSTFLTAFFFGFAAAAVAGSLTFFTFFSFGVSPSFSSALGVAFFFVTIKISYSDFCSGSI
jgi:hypothetical protein